MKSSSEAVGRSGSAASHLAMSWTVSASSMASAVSRLMLGMAVPGVRPAGRRGGGEAVGVGAGLDDVAAEGDAVDDGGAEAGVSEGLGPAARRAHPFIVLDGTVDRVAADGPLFSGKRTAGTA
jgi:hypothetical protein